MNLRPLLFWWFATLAILDTLPLISIVTKPQTADGITPALTLLMAAVLAYALTGCVSTAKKDWS